MTFEADWALKFEKPIIEFPHSSVTDNLGHAAIPHFPHLSSVCLSLSLLLSQSVSLSLSLCPSFCLCLSLSLCVSLPLCLCLSVCLSVSVSLSLSVCLCISLSLSLGFIVHIHNYNMYYGVVARSSTRTPS